ncbi:MAG: hypothetical protein HY881_06910 [Deltaproteobacteria bacterium]|nr:hypothetical protein [Deltaproteobacteria bacterium]
MSIPKLNKWVAGLSVVLLLAILGGVIMEKKLRPSSLISSQLVKELPESFTFFDLGANTRFSGTIRSDLSDHLGSDAIAYRSQIDLSVNSPEFLQTFFPELYALNLQLNYPPRERIEHNAVKLMYRYSQKVDVPFKYVEVVFSGYSQRPLYFSIIVSHDGAEIIDALHQKYGPPEEIQGLKSPTKASFWRKNNDLLLVSIKSDRYGNPEYHIMIYYVNSLKELLNIEKEEARQREDRLKKASDKVF